MLKDTIFDATSFTHNCAKSGLPNLFHSKNTHCLTLTQNRLS